MANRIKGITVEIGGDTTGLDKALKGVNNTIRTTQSSLRDVNRLLKLDPKNTTLLSQKQKLLKDSINATKEKLNGLKEAQKQAKEQLERGELGQDKYDALQREIVQTENELKRLEQEAQSCENKLAKMSAVGDKMQKVGDGMASAGKKFMPASAAVAGLGAISVKTAGEFDAAMGKVAAVSGATGKDFDKLRAKAREMGAKTKFSATESAEAMNYMAMAGWKTEDMLSGIEGVMNLAAASGEDLATTSDIVTDALTAFGLKASDSGHFADVLAAASSNANTNVHMLGESFKYAAPVAGALGSSAEDTTLALGLMANAGIKASQSGTALRTGLSNMAKPTKQMQQYMDRYNITLQKNSDGSVNLRDTMELLRDKMGGLSSSEQAAAASAIFGKNAMSGWLAIINSSDKDFNKLVGAIDNADGASKEMAETMQDNLMGQLTILKSQLQELAISFGDALMPIIRKVVSALQSFIDKLNHMSEGQRRAVLVIGGLVAAIGPLLFVMGTIISKAGVAISAFIKLAPVFVKLKGAIATAGGAMGILRKALLVITGPVGIIVGVVAGLIAAFVHLWKTNDKFRKTITAIWTQIKNTVGKFIDGIKQRLQSMGISFSKVTAVIKKVWDALCKVLAPVFEGAFRAIANFLKTVLNVILGLLDVFIGIFKGNWKQVWNGVKEIFSSVWIGIKGILSAALNAMKGVFNTVLNWIKGIWQKTWSGIKTFASGIWNGIKSIATSVFNRIKNAIITPIRLAKTGLAGIWKGIKSTAVSVWDGIKSSASSVWNGIKKAVSSPINALKSVLSSAWSSIKSTASSAWAKIKSAITSPITTAKDKLSGIIKKIKGLFPLSIGKIFSDLKLPHITVSGGKAPYGLFGKGKLPSFGIKWYARAMDKGMILNNPTIFGAMNGNLLGAGEAGSETVVGTDSLMNMITSAVSGIGDEIVNALNSTPRAGNVNINVEVNGADNPEDWGKRLVKQMKLEMRTV